MFIKTIHIETFGILRDWSVDLSPGLTVFVGPNEAGKSTLLGFVRAMLFGFPSRRSAEVSYPALGGGRLGGRIVLGLTERDGVAVGGEMVVERFDEKRGGLSIVLPGGGEGGEESLRALLGQADRGLFQSIFAFSLTELQSFATLNAAGVRDHIFSASIAGAGRSASAVKGRLTAGMKEIYSPGGRKHGVAAVVEELESLSRQIDESRAALRRYGSVCEAQQACEAEMAASASAEETLWAEQGRLETLLACWPIQTRAADIRAKLAELSSSTSAEETFPVDGLARLAERTARLESAERAASEAASEDEAARSAEDAAAKSLAEADAAGLPADWDAAETALAELRAASARQDELDEQFKAAQTAYEVAVAAAELCRRRYKNASTRWVVGSVVVISLLVAVMPWQARSGNAAVTVLLSVVFAAFVSVALWRQAVLKRESVPPEDPSTLGRRLEALSVRREAARALVAERSRALGLAAEASSAEVAALDQRWRACRRVADQREALAARVAEAGRRLAARAAEAERAREAVAALFAEAGVVDERAFRERSEMTRARQELRRELTALESQLTERLGGPSSLRSVAEGAAVLEAELVTGQVDGWRERLAEAGEALTRAKARHEQAVRAHQDAGRSRAAMEESVDVPTLEMVLASRRSELAGLVDQWRVRALARTLVEETLREFVRARQPAVLAQAAASFEAVTGGAYARIEQEIESDTLTVTDRQGGRKSPEHLSRGTAEQLYLCLRLGLASEFARQRSALPVVMDDVLVNFDPLRASRMAAELVRFAREHQVLLMTCQPGTVSLLREACGDEGVRVVEMGR